MKRNIITILPLVLVLVFFTSSEAHAGAVINKPPTTLGLISGLVGYWPFDGNAMSETNAYDLSGNGNHGTLTNGPARVIGKIGQALHFSRSNTQYVDVGTNMDLLGEMSAFTWVYVDDTQNAQRIIAHSSGLASLPRQFSLAINTTPIFGVSWGSSASFILSGNTTPVSGRWYHVGFTRSGSSGNWRGILYVDGMIDDEVTTATNPTDASNPTYIGNGSWSGAQVYPFQGIIDEVRVYNRILSPDEIKRLYKVGATFKVGVAPNTGTLKDGLVGYWSFDGNAMSETNAYDLSGNGNHGTLTGGVFRKTGKIGQALDFDGSSGYVNAGNQSSLQITSSTTLAAWFKLDKTQNGIYPRILSKLGNAPTAGYELLIGSPNDGGGKQNKPYLQLGTSGGSLNWAVASAIQTGVWYHVVGVYNPTAGTGEIYLNGNLEKAETTFGSSAIGNNAVDLNSGRWSGAGSNYFDGILDDVRIYNRVLSSDEIKRLYKIGSTLKIGVAQNTGTLKDGLVGYWSFDGPDMAGNTAYDRSGQGNTGTLTNGPERTIGRIGQALNFSRSNTRYVDVGTNMDLLGEMSAFAWVNFEQQCSTAPQVVIGHSSNFLGSPRIQQFGLFCGGDDGSEFHVSWGTTIRLTGNIVPGTGRWYHVGFTRSGSSGNWDVALYIDGLLDNSTNVSANPTDTANATWIGATDANTNNWPLSGIIDEVRVYNRPLSADEVKRLYNMGK